MNTSSILATMVSLFSPSAAYNKLFTGLPTVIPGATGVATRQPLVDQRTASASQRKMRKLYGSQPEHRKARRIERYANRIKKRNRSFCNNVDAQGNVVKN